MQITLRKLFGSQLIVLLSMVYASNAYSWNLFGPKSYEDCVLDGIKNAKSDMAANAVMYACRQKFPDKTPTQKYDLPTQKYDPPGVFLLSALGMSRPTLNQLISNIQLNQLRTVQTGTNTYGYKSFDYGHHLSLEITNRNDFPIHGLEIGLQPKKGTNCSWDDRDYAEIYTCTGSAYSRGSGVFRCEIPRLETRKYIYACLTGFGFYGSDEETTAFMRKYNIPNRQN